MKRVNNIYPKLYDFNNIRDTYNIVKRNTKNKHKIEIFDDFYSINIYRIYKTLLDKKYIVGKYNKFYIYEPKERLILSQNIFDKVINHLIAYQLSNILDKSLINSNIATRDNKGTNYGIKLLKKYLNNLHHKNYYVLKIDISKYFYNIDHNILKNLILQQIKDKDFMKIVNDIIDSTNNIDEYTKGKGLPIGNMTSQILGIFYLNDIDHYIKEQLKIKYYIRYMDDFILINESKDYLSYCLTKIKKLLDKYKLNVNNKTVILNKKQGICFLGYRFYNNKINILSSNKRKIIKKLKKLKKYDYNKFILTKKSYKGYLKYTKMYKIITSCSLYK